MQRIFRQTPEENVIIEICNLLASKPILDIQKKEVDSILSRYTINVYRQFQKNIYEFYAVLLNQALKGGQLDAADRNVLHHLKDLLRLHERDIDFIHTKLTSDLYRKRYEAAICNGRLSDTDDKALDELAVNLQLPSKAASKISEEVRGRFVRIFLDKIVAKQRISPDEDNEFKAVAKSLKVDVQVDKTSRQLLDRYKLFWKLENQPLEELEVVINLQKNEQCYFTATAEWHEERTSRGTPYWKYIDKGDFFLTNKRVIFSGRIKNTSIRLDKILSFKSSEDGVQLYKDAGKSPLLVFKKDGDVFPVILARAMRESDW